jgi:hypothetical protein
MLSILIALALAQDPLMRAPFDAMEKGIRAGDVEAFRAAWHPAGYAHNLVGDGGVAGSDIFPEFSGRSYPKPDLMAAVSLGEGVAVVPARIFAFREEDLQDQVDVLLVKHGDGWLVLGIGGMRSRKEVEALADRWRKNEFKEPVLVDAPLVAGVDAVFSRMEKALRARDAAAFKVLWHAEGLARNVVGRSGISGASFFEQGSFKKWFPKPDLGQVLIREDTAVVTCLIWSWEREEAVDRVTFVLVKQGEGWVVLGGGENRAEALALADRWRNNEFKEPLPPDAPLVKGVGLFFSRMEKALRARDAAAFKVLWHAEALERNVVGRSGISAGSFFEQGSFKKWFPKPDLGQVLIHDDTAVVPCVIWSWEREEGVDGLTFVLVNQGEGWVALGGGENRTEALALAERWRLKEPLDPPVAK